MNFKKEIYFCAKKVANLGFCLLLIVNGVKIGLLGILVVQHNFQQRHRH